MAISSISSTTLTLQQVKPTEKAAPTVLTPGTTNNNKPSADGDSPAVEAAESAAIKLSEKQHGGYNQLV